MLETRIGHASIKPRDERETIGENVVVRAVRKLGCDPKPAVALVEVTVLGVKDVVFDESPVRFSERAVFTSAIGQPITRSQPPHGAFGIVPTFGTLRAINREAVRSIADQKHSLGWFVGGHLC